MLSTTLDPSGQPWTKASITAHIAKLANDMAVLSRRYSDIQDSDSPLYIADEATQQIAANQLLGDIVALEQEQRQAQAIAAFLAQGSTPSVVGAGAVNVGVSPTGQPVFVTTPATPPPPTVPVPPGTAAGGTAPGAQPGITGPIKPGPSLPTGGPKTVATAAVARLDENGNPISDPIGYPFLPNVPKRWVNIAALIAAGLFLFRKV